jgi:hypothetical protein
MGGFVQVTTPFHRWFFISFWSIAVVVILNLVVAFILEAFFTKDDQRRSQEVSGSSVGAPSANESSGLYSPVGSPKTRIGRIGRAVSTLNLHEGFY